MNLTDEQAQAREAITCFLRGKDPSYSVTGLAGTGKTHLAAQIAKEFNGIPCAYTGRAAANFGRKAGLESSTLHGLLYHPDEEITHVYDKSDPPKTIKTERKVRFRKKPKNNLHGKLLVIDETSMVSQQMGADLLETGAKLLGFGDHGQLPPIKGTQFFQTADIRLDQIQRQAKDSAIIRQAWSVRNNGCYQSDGDDFQIIKTGSATYKRLLPEVDAILCWKRDTRNKLNETLRAIHGLSGHPKAGEPMMCIKNCPMYGVQNGVIYRLVRDWNPDTDREIVIDLGGTEMAIPLVQLCHDQEELKRGMNSGFDFGYALTVHKSQGSEWPHVMLLDEYRMPTDYRAWLYTGITRAKQKITVARARA